VTRHRGTWRGHAERRCADTPSTRAQAPPGDRMFYKGQTLTFQKGYANAAEDGGVHLAARARARRLLRGARGRRCAARAAVAGARLPGALPVPAGGLH